MGTAQTWTGLAASARFFDALIVNLVLTAVKRKKTWTNRLIDLTLNCD
ncbi:hypothetical protein [Lactiplantibacillus pentosus]